LRLSQKRNSDFVIFGEQIRLLQSSWSRRKERAMKFQFMIGVTIILLATCSAQQSAPADSGVAGQVFIGPMCPVVQMGQECPDQPYQAVLTVNSLEGERIAQVQTDEQGRYKIPLEPGNYILHPESPNVMLFAAEAAFIVEAGKFTQLAVHYDSGIR
jgi:uncharacterized membrane protein